MLSEDEDDVDSDGATADIKLPGVKKGGCGFCSWPALLFLIVLQVTSALARRGQR